MNLVPTLSTCLSNILSEDDESRNISAMAEAKSFMNQQVEKPRRLALAKQFSAKYPDFDSACVWVAILSESGKRWR